MFDSTLGPGQFGQAPGLDNGSYLHRLPVSPVSSLIQPVGLGYPGSYKVRAPELPDAKLGIRVFGHWNQSQDGPKLFNDMLPNPILPRTGNMPGKMLV